MPTGRPAFVLAPMQDVTDVSFIRVLARRSLPDWFVTEYFRVHADSRLSRQILRSIDENPSSRPIFAQIIGRDAKEMVRTARELERHPVAGIDLNLGCPAPIVCRKDAGGGLLRDPDAVARLLAALREAIRGRFTVKTRIGFTSADEFPVLLEIFRNSGIDGLTIHARTVADRYQTPVHPDYVRMAVDQLDCPVIANGNVVDLETGRGFLAASGAAGLMIGRGAIRNPWIFSQLQAAFEGRNPPRPTHRDLLTYLRDLHDETALDTQGYDPIPHIQRMKRTAVYIAEGIASEFGQRIRRARTPDEYHGICAEFLDHEAALATLPPENSKLFCGFSTLLGSHSFHHDSLS